MAKHKKTQRQIQREIPPLVKLKVLEQRALESYDKGDFVRFAATYDYFGLTHADEHALEIGRADPSYKTRLSEIDLQYSGNICVQGFIRINPSDFDTRK